MLANALIWVVDCLRNDKCFQPPGDDPFVGFPAAQERGTTFTDAYSTAVNTTPSITSILTGRYPRDHGIHRLIGPPLSADQSTIATLLTERGYSCRAEVTGPLHPALGLGRGFANYNYREPSDHVFGPWGEELLEELKTWGRDEPSFLLLHTFELHDLPVVPAALANRRYGTSRYERSLYGVDSFAARLLRTIDLSNTVLVILGDHGEVIPLGRAQRALSLMNRRVFKGRIPGDLLRFGHGYDVREQLVRVPLIFSGFRCPPREVQDGPASQVDVLPTLLSLLGLTSDDASLAGQPLIGSRLAEASSDRPVFFEASDTDTRFLRERRGGMRLGRHVVQFSLDDPHEAVVYDVITDPSCRADLSKKDEGLTRALLERGMAFFEGSGETAPPEDVLTAEEHADIEERLRSLGYL